ETEQHRLLQPLADPPATTFDGLGDTQLSTLDPVQHGRDRRPQDLFDFLRRKLRATLEGIFDEGALGAGIGHGNSWSKRPQSLAHRSRMDHGVAISISPSIHRPVTPPRSPACLPSLRQA